MHTFHIIRFLENPIQILAKLPRERSGGKCRKQTLRKYTFEIKNSPVENLRSRQCLLSHFIPRIATYVCAPLYTRAALHTAHAPSHQKEQIRSRRAWRIYSYTRPS